ncbi:MAG TPA: tetraacyldisaccharide 4'-kinase [Gemmatimonadaceae bacterium]|nr:tetraacyldisaccharide 4'-kinase [Gemmatimonadaceae bacterium]
MRDAGAIARDIWYGTDAVAGVARFVLTPFERVFGGIVGARDVLYDAGWLASHDTAIPAISVGNLTVGGTGKTPVAAWIAEGLVARGAKPAIVLRGYGDDEPLVHETLNPSVPVVIGADRVAAIEDAARRGADIAVLDDAFQHRRAQRVADIVVISADQWTPVLRMLPAGPWREPLRAVRRATLVIVTRKAAPDAVVEEVHQRVAAVAPSVPRVSVVLAPGELVGATGSHEALSLDVLRGRVVRAIVSIGDPAAFVRQLEALGATVHARVFPDHHTFSQAEIEGFASGSNADDLVVCTLKDAVKLRHGWPRLAPPLYYVSQRVMVERGVGGIERVLDDLVRTRSMTSPNAG